MAPFVVGDRVHAATLGTGTVKEVRNAGRYLIELKGRSMIVDGSQLEPAQERRGGKKPSCDSSAAAPGEPPPAPSLDLHGTTALEAVEALDAFLNDALMDGCAEARVIHGRSGGKLKAAVHGRLKQLSSVRGFRLDHANPGVTIVSF